MRKEIIFAILAGIIFGLVVALGIWRANSALEDEPATTENTETTDQTETALDGSLTISQPEENDVVTETSVVVNGITSPNTWVAISADTDALVKVSSNDTTAGFLNGKLVAGEAITFVENNNGGNETLTIAATDPTALAIDLG